ncbi:MAG: Lpg1974 family pore-forming outer membrane protein [Chlamydiota bacterium]
MKSPARISPKIPKKLKAAGCRNIPSDFLEAAEPCSQSDQRYGLAFLSPSVPLVVIKFLKNRWLSIAYVFRDRVHATYSQKRKRFIIKEKIKFCHYKRQTWTRELLSKTYGLLTVLLIALPIGAIGKATASKEPQPPQPNKQQNLFNGHQPAVILSGEFIYWTVVEGDVDYAVRMTKPLPGETTTLAQGDVASTCFDWDPGYRLSLGYFRAPNFWELLGEYTFLHVNANDSTEQPATSDLFLNGTFPHIFSGNLTKATSETLFHYRLVNLLAKRVFFPINNPHLRLRLGGGITALWLRQSWKVRYFIDPNDTTTVRNRWRYWGIGPRIQLGFDWFWGNDIYVTGQFAMALVVGHYRNRFSQETTQPIGDALFQDYRLSFNSRCLVGPSYQKSFSWGRVELFVGYEFTSWTNLQEIYRSTTSTPEAAKQLWTNKSPVSLHGLTTRLTLNF